MVVAAALMDQETLDKETLDLEHLVVREWNSVIIPVLFSGQCLPHGKLPLPLDISLAVAAVVVMNRHDQTVELVAAAVVTLVMAQANLVSLTPEAVEAAVAVTAAAMVVMVAMVLLF